MNKILAYLSTELGRFVRTLTQKFGKCAALSWWEGLSKPCRFEKNRNSVFANFNGLFCCTNIGRCSKHSLAARSPMVETNAATSSSSTSSVFPFRTSLVYHRLARQSTRKSGVSSFLVMSPKRIELLQLVSMVAQPDRASTASTNSVFIVFYSKKSLLSWLFHRSQQ